jgi:hypothetical protein
LHLNLRSFVLLSLLALLGLTCLASASCGKAPTAEANVHPIEAGVGGTPGESAAPRDPDGDLGDYGVLAPDQVGGENAINPEPTLSGRTELSNKVTASPLGALKPTRGLLPSDTVSVTLSLTTSVPADCRWAEQPATSYEAMPHDFEQGQGTTLHGAIVRGFSVLDERRFYARCQDLSGTRDPNGYEAETHLRVLGPWEGGYPRIANLWATYDPELGAGFYARYDLFIPYSWKGEVNQAAAIRAANPYAKVLAYQYATKGRPELNPLTAEWQNASPGDPGYNCLLRDSNGEILLYAGHPMNNMTHPYCRALLVQQNVELFLSQRPDEGADLAYDGIYWDLLHAHISWLGDDIDGDLDGQPDDLNALDAAYEAGVEAFLTEVRAYLPNVMLVGNEAPHDYAPWINGRLYEWHLAAVLNGSDWLTWDAVAVDYLGWTPSGQAPLLTFLGSAPEPTYTEKFYPRCLCEMAPAMEAEAAASYQRMRYGLTTALMGDGLFSYDYGLSHGQLWWYDEFGAPAGDQQSTLPPQGYLGQPAGAPTLLAETLDAPDQVSNGGFERGLRSWKSWIDRKSGAAATIDIERSSGISDTAALHMVATRSIYPSSITLYQANKSTVAGQSYTLSFWARSDVSRTVYAKIVQGHPPGANYGFSVQALVTPRWQHFHLWDDADVTAGDGQLVLQLGEKVGELWLDDVQFQTGALGVWARSFENGLAVINATREVQTVPLPAIYWKLEGDQAPLFQTRVDDDEARASMGWTQQRADYDQFGGTVQTATAGGTHPLATVAYVPSLAYDGTYEVLAWVVPSVTQSSGVSVTVRHAHGETVALLDQAVGEVGWRSLGTYPFRAGETGGVVLAATGEGTVVADAFKWESTARYNDGSPVSQITLQPQDGIVLLSPAYHPGGASWP